MRTALVLVLLAPLANAQDHAPLTSGRPAPPEQTCYDVKRYELDVTVDPEERAIHGQVEMFAQLLVETDAIVLDLDPRLKVQGVVFEPMRSGVLANKHELEFSQANGEVRIEVGEAFADAATSVDVGDVFRVTTRFRGRPRVAPNPPWDGGFQWATTPSGAPWIATSNQMQGADLWWPCKDQPDDEPDSASIRVTVPSGLVCASNGMLRAVEHAEATSTYHWEVNTPINTYGIALNIAPYVEISREVESAAGGTFPVTYWVLPENRQKGEALFEDLIAQLEWFESVFGPYPFRADKCGVVETPHLGMEHQSITAYGNEYKGNPWGTDQGFDFLLHHELAHEWWANLVTARNWNDFWIHESFATYAQSLYSEHVMGPSAYRTRMAEIRGGILNRAPVAPREPMSASDVYFGDTGSDIYNKGAWMLHTLRWWAGDEKFFLALRRMAYPDPAKEGTSDGSACRFTDTDEILAIAEEHTGLELDWFFEVYLRQPVLPRLMTELEGDTLRLAWLLPSGYEFPLPVEVEVDGEILRVEMPGGEGLLDVTDAVSVKIDPRGWLLMSNER